MSTLHVYVAAHAVGQTIIALVCTTSNFVCPLAIIRNGPTGWHIFHGSFFKSADLAAAWLRAAIRWLRANSRSSIPSEAPLHLEWIGRRLADPAGPPQSLQLAPSWAAHRGVPLLRTHIGLRHLAYLLPGTCGPTLTCQPCAEGPFRCRRCFQSTPRPEED
jgi:hypothetical protein